MVSSSPYTSRSHVWREDHDQSNFKELAQLHAAGILSDEEFAAAKARLLSA